MSRRRIPVVSLFSGAMGLDLGLVQAGFRIAVAVERDPVAAETIRTNRPRLPLIEKQIEDVTTQEILEAGKIEAGSDFVIVGGPSCQAFSTAGQRRSLGDPRGGMFREFIRVVRESRPRFFVMENVKGLLSAAIRHRPLKERGPGYPELEPDEELGSAFRLIANELQELGYYTVFDVLDSANYGTPQIRKRLVFIGSRDGELIRMPRPTHNEDGCGGLKAWVRLKDAIGDLKEESPTFYRTCPSKEKYIKLVPAGGNWRDLPDDLRQEALGNAYVSWGGRSGFFRRLSMDKPSPALTTRPDSKATMLFHPVEIRPLSVGEYARIQQFPDNWSFAGSIRQQYRQVGDAVPVGLGKAIGRALKKAMRSDHRSDRMNVVECHNTKLIRALAKRPRTIVNPPRMRKNRDLNDLTAWFNGRSRRRSDVIEFAAPEIAAELSDLADQRSTKGGAVIGECSGSTLKNKRAPQARRSSNA